MYIYHIVLSHFFSVFVHCQFISRDFVYLRVVRRSGYFPAVSGPICVDELPFLTEQFVRMSAEIISLGLQQIRW